MTQNEFFNILMDGLKDIPEKKLRDIISYYDNEFELGRTAGKTESEIINELEQPNIIVKKYKDENSDFYPNPDNNANNINISNNDTTKIPTTKMQAINKKNINNNDYNSNNGFGNSKTNINFEDINKSNNSNTEYSSHNQNPHNSFKNFTTKTSYFNINTILKIFIIILALIIFFPVVTGIIGVFIGILGAAIGLFAGSIGVLIGGTFKSLIALPHLPAFVANFPYPVIVLFSLGSISLSILLLLLFYYFCKLFIRLLIKFFSSLKPNGGNF